MELTITLDDTAALQLREQAEARNLPPEEAAKDLLGALLASLAADKAWPGANERRHELIRKKFDGGLTTDEEAELGRLQAAAADRVAPLDRLMIARVEEALRRLKGQRDGSPA